MTDQRLARFARAVLAYNVGVVLFGAVVRATSSGAGCGSQWPTCGGSLVPAGGGAETLIEFGHRASASVALVLVLVLALWVRRARPKGNPTRTAAIAAVILIVNEALIGAALVLFEWVAHDESVARMLSIVVHLVNTFLLLGALTITAWLASGRPAPSLPTGERRRRLLLIAGTALLVVGAAGAITALGDTLFPPDSVGAGLLDDLGGAFVVRLRWIHPVIAVATAAYLLWLAAESRTGTAAGTWLTRLVYAQLAAGALNLALLAPLWMQVVHLLLADLVWIAFVLLALEVAADREPAPVP